jgi:hypothetical protein
MIVSRELEANIWPPRESISVDMEPADRPRVLCRTRVSNGKKEKEELNYIPRIILRDVYKAKEDRRLENSL